MAKASRKKAAPRTRRTAKTSGRGGAKPRKAIARRPVAARAASAAASRSALFAPVKGAERRDIGHVKLDVGRAGAARVKRMIYPVGFRW